MMRHRFFEWDVVKARANELKHRVRFEDATAVLVDDQAGRYHLEKHDDKHSMSEDRYVTIGSDPMDRQIILFIVWTERRKMRRILTRIISARRATPRKGDTMPKQSASASGRFVTTAADELPARTAQDMVRLKASMRIPVKPSEAREYDELGPEVQRDASGKIVKHKLGPIRSAILASLDQHKMTRYKLWKKAHSYCDTLSASMVYEYLRGTRNIGSESVEALLKAAGLKVVKRGDRKEKKPISADATVRR